MRWCCWASSVPSNRRRSTKPRSSPIPARARPTAGRAFKPATAPGACSQTSATDLDASSPTWNQRRLVPRSSLWTLTTSRSWWETRCSVEGASTSEVAQWSAVVACQATAVDLDRCRGALQALVVLQWADQLQEEEASCKSARRKSNSSLESVSLVLDVGNYFEVEFWSWKFDETWKIII